MVDEIPASPPSPIFLDDAKTTDDEGDDDTDTNAPPSWFAFYSHQAQRAYYYEPVSGCTTWSLPHDAVVSHLPGAPKTVPPQVANRKWRLVPLLFLVAAIGFFVGAEMESPVVSPHWKQVQRHAETSLKRSSATTDMWLSIVQEQSSQVWQDTTDLLNSSLSSSNLWLSTVREQSCKGWEEARATVEHTWKDLGNRKFFETNIYDRSVRNLMAQQWESCVSSMAWWLSSASPLVQQPNMYQQREKDATSTIPENVVPVATRSSAKENPEIGSSMSQQLDAPLKGGRDRETIESIASNTDDLLALEDELEVPLENVEPVRLPLVVPSTPDDATAKSPEPHQRSASKKDDSNVELELSFTPKGSQPPPPESDVAANLDGARILVDATNTTAAATTVANDDWVAVEASAASEDGDRYNRKMVDDVHQKGGAAQAANFPSFVESTDDFFDSEEHDISLEIEEQSIRRSAADHLLAGVDEDIPRSVVSLSELHRDDDDDRRLPSMLEDDVEYEEKGREALCSPAKNGNEDVSVDDWTAQTLSTVDETTDEYRGFNGDGAQTVAKTLRQHRVHITIEAPEMITSHEATLVDGLGGSTTAQAGEQTVASQQHGVAIGREPSLEDDDMITSLSGKEQANDAMQVESDDLHQNLLERTTEAVLDTIGNNRPKTNQAAFDEAFDPVTVLHEGSGAGASALHDAVEERVSAQGELLRRSSSSRSEAPVSVDGASDVASEENIDSVPAQSSVLERIFQSAQAAGFSIDNTTVISSSRFFRPPFRAAACYPESKLSHCRLNEE